MGLHFRQRLGQRRHTQVGICTSSENEHEYQPNIASYLAWVRRVGAGTFEAFSGFCDILQHTAGRGWLYVLPRPTAHSTHGGCFAPTLCVCLFFNVCTCDGACPLTIERLMGRQIVECQSCFHISQILLTIHTSPHYFLTNTSWPRPNQ